MEQCDPGPASFVARLTIELLRPVPLAPLEIQARTIRPGKKVQWIEATLSADGVEVARATGLRLRTEDLALPVPAPAPLPIPGPDESKRFEITFAADFSMPLGFWDAVEVRQARGSWTESGEATVWFRLRLPVVAGEEPSQLQRVAAAADFGNGVSAALERGKYLFINPDLTISLHRLPTWGVGRARRRHRGRGERGGHGRERAVRRAGPHRPLGPAAVGRSALSLDIQYLEIWYLDNLYPDI